MARKHLWAFVVALAACAPALTPIPPDDPPTEPSSPPTAVVATSDPTTEPAKAALTLRDPAPAGADAWATIEPEAAGFDAVALQRILESATASETSSLLIVKDGKVLVERYFGAKPRPIETMSMTKSLVSIAIGALLDEKKISSIDAPLSTWYPDFSKGKKAKITLRHVLTHSTGLSHGMGAGKMNKEKDRLQYARSREVEKEPGSEFSYNNEATQLLSGIVAKAAGMPLDQYMAERVFKPLGITEWQWEKDKAGNVQAFYGAALHARDLAKIGLMMTAGGQWNGKTIVSSQWVKESTSAAKPADYHGYLWWLRFRQGHAAITKDGLKKLEQRGFTAAKKLDPMVGRAVPATQEREALWLEAGALLDESERRQLAHLIREGVQPYDVEKGAPFGFAADGWLGQQLIVLENGVVIVRQHEAPESIMADDAYNQKVGYFKLARDVELALLPARPKSAH